MSSCPTPPSTHPQVAFSNVTVEDLPPAGIDDLSVKFIRLSQLTIEYLLHVQASRAGRETERGAGIVFILDRNIFYYHD